MKHSPQWYMALGRSLGHPGFVTAAEVAEQERLTEPDPVR